MNILKDIVVLVVIIFLAFIVVAAEFALLQSKTNKVDDESDFIKKNG